MECLGLHNKPTAEVHPEHMVTGPKEQEEKEEEGHYVTYLNKYLNVQIHAFFTKFIVCV
jgi:hypothetical protein